MIFLGFAAPTTALALDPEHVTRSEDGSLDPAGLSAAIGLDTGEPEGIASPAGLESRQAPSILIKPDLPPNTNSELSRSALYKLG